MVFYSFNDAISISKRWGNPIKPIYLREFTESTMEELFRNKYRIPSARASWWDYGQNGYYFVTICTDQRIHYFGDICDDEMILSDAGCIAGECWMEIPEHFPFVKLGAFVVMPNHVHGIIIIDEDGNGDDGRDRACPVCTTTECPTPTVETVDAIEMGSPAQRRFRNQGKNTLSAIVGSYKAAVTKSVRLSTPEFKWQTRFHDHIIRNDKSYSRIADYIENNVFRWNDDKFHPDNVKEIDPD